MISLRKPLLLALLAAPAATQTFVVDVNNGPGTDYTQISDAVAAVPDGATLEVRPGTYMQFRIRNKNLTVIGELGVVVSPPTFQTVAIEISDVDASQAVALRGLEIGSFLGPPRINLRDSAGSIVIDRCSGVVGPVSQSGGQLLISRCDRVFVRDCAFTADSFIAGPIDTYLSNVNFLNCDLRSQSFCIRQGGGRVQITASSLMPQGPNPVLSPALLFLAGGELVVNGDSVLAGTANLSVDLAAGTGTLVLDSDTVLQSFPPNAVDPNVTLVNRDVPRLDAQTQELGGIADGVLAVPMDATGFLFVGFPDGPIALPLIADPWFVSSSVLQSTGGSPLVTGSYTVPNAAWVRGVEIGWQGIVIEDGAATASNAAAYVHY